MTATETEYKITLSQGTFQSGAYVIRAVNSGTQSHNLNISGPGVTAATADLAPGQSSSLNVTLQAGSYELWCSIGSHRTLGMDVHITVG